MPGEDWRAALTGPIRHTERAVIGDQLRLPTAWCEMSPCISRHADADAEGEADIRARAIAAGWRVDGFGRLACPACQQTNTRFRSTRPVAAWDRRAALTKAALVTAGLQDMMGAAAGHADETHVIPALPPASLAPGTGSPGAGSHLGRGRHRRAF